MPMSMPKPKQLTEAEKRDALATYLSNLADRLRAPEWGKVDFEVVEDRLLAEDPYADPYTLELIPSGSDIKISVTLRDPMTDTPPN